MTQQIPPLDIALSYISRGWSPVPVPYQKKGPVLKDWQNLRISETDAPRYFNGQPQNIGVILGPASDNLVDIDLDSPEAVAVAPYILPSTALFGRGSNRDSGMSTITAPDRNGCSTRKSARRKQGAFA